MFIKKINFKILICVLFIFIFCVPIYSLPYKNTINTSVEIVKKIFTYNNRENGFSIQYPNKWKIINPDKNIVFLKPEKHLSSPTSITITVEDTWTNSLEENIQSHNISLVYLKKKYDKENPDKLKIIWDKKNFKLNDLIGYNIHCNLDVREEFPELEPNMAIIITRQYLFVRNYKIYSITTSSFIKDFSKYEKEFEKIVNTFKLLDTTDNENNIDNSYKEKNLNVIESQGIKVGDILLKTGDNESKIVKILGPGEKSDSLLGYENLGLGFSINPKTRKITRIVIVPTFKGKTYKGIKIGDSKTLLKKLYPKGSFGKKEGTDVYKIKNMNFIIYEDKIAGMEIY